MALALALVLGPVPAQGAVAAPSAQTASSPDDGPWWQSGFSVPGSDAFSPLLAVTPSDRVIMAGGLTKAITCPGVPGALTPRGGPSSRDSFVASLTDDRSQFAWRLAAWSPFQSSIKAVAVRQDGTIVIAGDFTNVMYFPRTADPLTDDSIALTSQGNTSGGFGARDLFVAALSPDGAGFVWAINAGGKHVVRSNTTLSVESLQIRRDGSPVVAGYINNGPAYFPPSTDDSIPDRYTNYIAAVSPDGSSWAWKKALTVGVSSMALTRDDTPIIYGSFGGKPAVSALHPTTRDVMWTRQVLTSSARAHKVAVTSDDTVVVSGDFESSLMLPKSAHLDDSITLIGAGPSGSWNTFVAGMDFASTYFSWGQSSLIHSANPTTFLATNAGGGAVFAAAMTRDNSPVNLPTGNGDFLAVPTIGNLGTLVAGIKPDGSGFGWAQRLGGPSTWRGDLALLSDGSPIVSGYQAAPTQLPNGVGTSMTLPYVSGGEWIFATLRLRTPRVTGLAATATTGSASVSFSVDDTDGLPATRIEFALDDTSTVDAAQVGAASPYVISGLVNGQTYRVFARAINGYGTGSWAGPVSFTPEAPQPPPPPPPPPEWSPSAPLSVQASPGPREVTVRWQPPSDPGSSPISEYWVFASPGGERLCRVPPRSGPGQSCTINPLIPGQRYEFWVQAVNSAGQSPNSERAGAVPQGPPGPARVAVSVVDEVLTVSWEPPVNDGGLPVTYYRVDRRSPGGEWQEIAYQEAAWRSHVARDLRSGAPYEFRVRTWNSAGEGAPSEPVAGSVTLAPVTVTLPERVPPQSFTVLGDLPGKAVLRRVTASRATCSAMEGPGPQRVPNVVAFLGPGACTIAIWRSSASVDWTQVGTVQSTVAMNAPTPRGVMEMDVMRLTYPADSKDSRLPDDQEESYSAWVSRYRTPWTRLIPREVYGGPFVFCPAAAFRSTGTLHNSDTTRDRAVLRAVDRCAAVYRPAGTLPSANYDAGRSGAVPGVPGLPDSEMSVFEVAMLPVNLFPAMPRNVSVQPGAFEATITWDPPPTTARTPVDGYSVAVRPKGEREWTWLRVDSAARTARLSFEDRKWRDVPIDENIDVRVSAYNEAGRGGWAATDFRLDYRLPEFTNIPDVVPPQSWVPLFERRGNPDVSLQTRGSGCSITRARFLLFIGPGPCEVTYRIDDHLGNYVRWVTAFKVKVEEGADRPSRVSKLEMFNITFVDKEARPDTRSRELLEDLVGPDIEAVHIYEMVPGKVPRPLVSQRESEVRKALRAWSDRSPYVSRSPIQQSGLPEGDGDLLRIGFIRKG